jgi:hypothetical protein
MTWYLHQKDRVEGTILRQAWDCAVEQAARPTTAPLEILFQHYKKLTDQIGEVFEYNDIPRPEAFACLVISAREAYDNGCHEAYVADKLEGNDDIPPCGCGGEDVDS